MKYGNDSMRSLRWHRLAAHNNKGMTDADRAAYARKMQQASLLQRASHLLDTASLSSRVSMTLIFAMALACVGKIFVLEKHLRCARDKRAKLLSKLREMIPYEVLQAVLQKTSDGDQGSK